MPNPDAPQSLTAGYFDAVYRANPDPWNFASSPYEAAKYEATLAALPRPLYPSAFEAGCSIGVLTTQLAGRCGRLLSVDLSEQALRAARERCAVLDNVTFERRGLPGEFPAGPFDLIVVSEVGYYLDLPDLLKLRELTVSQLAPEGQLLLVHWTPPVPDYPLTGDEVHATFLEAAVPGRGPLAHLSARREEKYRLDLFERAWKPGAVPGRCTASRSRRPADCRGDFHQRDRARADARPPLAVHGLLDKAPRGWPPPATLLRTNQRPPAIRPLPARRGRGVTGSRHNARTRARCTDFQLDGRR